MKKKYSPSWKRSKRPGKQRKYRLFSPLHVKQKLVRSHLSSDLRKKYGTRSASLRKGDKVRVIHGKLRKHEGKVESVSLRKILVFVSGAEASKKDGTKKQLPFHPSNLMITELNMEDKLRQKSLEKPLEEK